MSTHNIGFYEDLTKIIFELSSNIIIYAPYFLCCIFVNKGADQLRCNRLYFCNIDRKIPLLPISENSSLWPLFVAVQQGLCLTDRKHRRQVFS